MLTVKKHCSTGGFSQRTSGLSTTVLAHSNLFPLEIVVYAESQTYCKSVLDSVLAKVTNASFWDIGSKN